MGSVHPKKIVWGICILMLGSNELREAEERNKPQRLLSNEQHRKRAEWEENKKCCQGSDWQFFKSQLIALALQKGNWIEKPKKASTICASSSNFSLL